MEDVDFGNTGLRVSRLAFGTGTHGWGHRSDQTALGLDGLANLLREAYDHGVTFWDVADQYGSHPHVANALQGLPRDAVTVNTKTTSKTAKDVTADVERFLRELCTETIDIVLLHGPSQADWPQRNAEGMEALSRAKEAGKVRAVGISCHGLGALRTAAETEWLDVILARINHAGVNMDGSVPEVVHLLEKLYAAGKALYAMKVLGVGQLADDVRGAIRYVLGLGTVHALTLGITSRAQLLEDVRLVEELAPGNPLR